MPVKAAGVHEVAATQAEIETWRKKYPRRHGTPYRVECDDCSRRFWLSGIGLGSHRRACPGPVWPKGKLFGELNPAQKAYAIKHAGDVISAELQAAAPEITRIMDEAVRN
jgi:hypothetical protein